MTPLPKPGTQAKPWAAPNMLDRSMTATLANFGIRTKSRIKAIAKGTQEAVPGEFASALERLPPKARPS